MNTITAAALRTDLPDGWSGGEISRVLLARPASAQLEPPQRLGRPRGRERSGQHGRWIDSHASGRDAIQAQVFVGGIRSFASVPSDRGRRALARARIRLAAPIRHPASYTDRIRGLCLNRPTGFLK